jgi:hypothetical protein
MVFRLLITATPAGLRHGFRKPGWRGGFQEVSPPKTPFKLQLFANYLQELPN